MSHICWVQPGGIWNRPAPELQQLLKVRMESDGWASQATLAPAASDILPQKSDQHPASCAKSKVALSFVWGSNKQKVLFFFFLKCNLIFPLCLWLILVLSKADGVAVRYLHTDVIRGNYFNNRKPISGASDRSGRSGGRLLKDLPWENTCCLHDINTESWGAASIPPKEFWGIHSIFGERKTPKKMQHHNKKEYLLIGSLRVVFAKQE